MQCRAACIEEFAEAKIALRMLVSDAQVHLWEVHRPDRPWPQEQQRPPHRPNGFSPEEMLAEMNAAGVDRAVIVPPTWVGENNATALQAAARYPRRFAVVGRFDVKAADARAQLEGLASGISEAIFTRIQVLLASVPDPDQALHYD